MVGQTVEAMLSEEKKVRDVRKRWGKIGSKFSHLTRVHPCYSEKAHFQIARIHLPVAPKCNIQCKFCKRDINKCEYRPGVTSYIASPTQALARLEKAVKEIPNLKVVGIAGPGEPLANSETFETFELVEERFPKLVKCIATNGLLLPRKVDELVALNVKTVTVTVNALDPEVASKIYSWIHYDGKLYRGEEGTKILIHNQLEGIEKASEKGLVVKVNTVLIPKINVGQIEGIAKEVASRGAVLMNIIPLIPMYEFKKFKPPNCDGLNAARALAEKHIPQFRLCRQCRADACGVPGLERGSPFKSRSEYYHA